ncbi:MAG TPA: hypothetical protein DDX91_06045 [Ruminococcaceae bacterium]|nr:hypothetical protein [Oscillospiraceae bacterium]
MFELYKDDPLYLAIMNNDKGKIEKLKAGGVVLSEHIRYMLTHAVGSLAVLNEYSYSWGGHICAIEGFKPERLMSVLRNLRAELGEPMYYSGSYSWEWGKRLYAPEMFSCVLDCFDNRKIPKKWVWKRIIDEDKAELAAIAAEHGWLKMPKKRDELIKYATDNNKTECLTFFLDFKNRTADLKAEQEKAEKKLMRELNANPDSLTELKKLWGFQKREDGTLVITSCKRAAGSSTEITVPEKIGKDTVTAIGDYAFSSVRSRLTEEQSIFRKQITRITLPDTIKTIGIGAFLDCSALREINIPDGVREINEQAFSGCRNLKEICLPDSVEKIGDSAFCYCGELTEIKIPQTAERLGMNAFVGCKSLKEIRLPKYLKEVGCLFYGCTALKETELPKGVEILTSYCFCGCYSLDRIVLHKGLKKIEKYVFANCQHLKELIIPEGVEEIGEMSFANCITLERVYLPASIRKIKNSYFKDGPPLSAFYNCPKVTVTVNGGSYSEKYCKRNNIPYKILEETYDRN